MSDADTLFPRAGSSARISDDGVYRYELTRIWGVADAGVVTWIMLNPSTANADVDDPTIRRCKSFSQRWQYGGMIVVNLFALRATDPAELARASDPVGPGNDEAIVAAVKRSDLVVVAWGAHGSCRNRDERVAALLRPLRLQPSALGVTQAGQPRHPLYLRADTPLEPWLGPKF